MIYKAFETNKINLEINNILLLYGQNDGARNEEISRILEKNKNSEILKYNETEILNNDNLIFENVLSNSLFVNKKIIIINKATDKILKIIENFREKKLAEVILIIKSDNLEKKSKPIKLIVLYVLTLSMNHSKLINPALGLSSLGSIMFLPNFFIIFTISASVYIKFCGMPSGLPARLLRPKICCVQAGHEGISAGSVAHCCRVYW